MQSLQIIRPYKNETIKMDHTVNNMEKAKKIKKPYEQILTDLLMTELKSNIYQRIKMS